MVGDSSDNISGLAGFGQKSWEKLNPIDKDRLVEALLNVCDMSPDLSDEKLQVKVNDNWKSLLLYWKLISFIELSEDEFSSMILTKLK